MGRRVCGMIGMGMALGVGALPAAAQSMALPASDPAGIARSGAQIAYGYSLEAASANPALLASLKGKGGAFLSVGMEMASIQQTLESNQRTLYSEDRNRAIGAFGLAARLTPKVTLGMKLDTPYLRHAELPQGAPSRYLGDSLNLWARRLEVQGAWAIDENLSVGLGLGAARLGFESGTTMRFGVPLDPSQPVSGANPIQGLVEQRIAQVGGKTVPSYSLGVRWAINPRWTVGFTHQSSLKGDLDMEAGWRGWIQGLYANDGVSLAPLGTDARAASLLLQARPQAAPGRTLELPSQTAVGVRHRVMPMVTWEADLRWTSADLRVPGFAQVALPSGVTAAPVELPEGKGHLSLHGSIEVELGKAWILRGGLALDQRSVEEATAEPLLGGTRTSAFSVGGAYKGWGGEWSIGYQYRQSEDQDTRNLDGVWSASGFRSTGTRARMEGMGHVVAIGFKKMF